MENTNLRLRAFRRKIGATAGEVADATGLSQTTVTRIELGEVSPQLETATRILSFCDEAARRYRVPVAERITATDLLPGNRNA